MLNIKEFNDLLELNVWESVEFACGDVRLEFTFLGGFLTEDGKKYYMLLEDEERGEDNEVRVYGYVCVRKKWPNIRSPRSDAEWDVLEDMLKKFQAEVGRMLEADDPDEDDEDYID